MRCGICNKWNNKLASPKLKAYIETDCDIGNGHSELGICTISDRLEYFDHACDGCGTPRELDGLGY
jgi:hypothetical protein